MLRCTLLKSKRRIVIVSSLSPGLFQSSYRSSIPDDTFCQTLSCWLFEPAVGVEVPDVLPRFPTDIVQATRGITRIQIIKQSFNVCFESIKHLSRIYKFVEMHRRPYTPTRATIGGCTRATTRVRSYYIRHAARKRSFVYGRAYPCGCPCMST